MKKYYLFLIGLLCFIPFKVSAQDITSSSSILLNENKISNEIRDGKENTYIEINKDDTIEIKNVYDIHGLYIIYELKSKPGSVKNELKEAKIGTNGFLHEYIDINTLLGPGKTLKIAYEEEVKIAEIYVLGEGKIPPFVEIWEKPYEEADLLLLPTHSDDEQLFLLGVMPTYVARGAKVQVAYFTIHYNNTIRLHEQLHGLYTVGIRNYPIISNIPDHYSSSLNGALYHLNKAGLTEEDALKYTTNLLRRFKPLVVVGHDENGEYSHGQHILNTYILEKALELSNDSSFDTESYNLYGGWNVPKTYLHLYKENQIIMDYDTPLDYFSGMTAFEISRVAFSKHVSQQGPTYTPWLNNVNKASEITKYSPVEYGLYRSLVGEDVLKNDMFENLEFRKQKEEITPQEKNDLEKQEETNKKQNININYRKYIPPVIVIIALIVMIIFTLYKKRLS